MLTFPFPFCQFSGSGNPSSATRNRNRKFNTGNVLEAIFGHETSPSPRPRTHNKIS